MWINKIRTFGIKASSSCSPWSKLWWTMFPSGPWWCLWRLLLLFFKFPPSRLFFKFPPPTTLLRKGFKWLKPAKNKFHLMWFHEFFQNRFQQIHLISLSGHRKSFIFKICQNVVAICITSRVFWSNFWRVYVIWNLCVLVVVDSFSAKICWKQKACWDARNEVIMATTVLIVVHKYAEYINPSNWLSLVSYKVIREY